ncbi:acetylglutamate kinase [Marivirga sp. S37H4]|uniref:Acetylglutamate kinase n=1 Tax=Marivirga aurantiaca TaxID=2802615 RepID=A0A934WXG2_9BACT|nr:acetylglutamate kinase [Marivirga aurantiaca]MBK6264923.1 acetylglutamate kinase [Marivirga aurantiaca]
MNPLKIIKIGGNIIDDKSRLQSFLKDFSTISGAKILIHGGGKIASELGAKMGISPKMHEGRRITDAETLDLVTMVYAGLINKNLVAQLQMQHSNAIGFSGADANLITATKRPAKVVDYGLVGDVAISGVQTDTLSGLLKLSLIPVFSPITHDGKGQLYNTNADTIASVLAMAMSKSYEVELIYCFDKKGVLEDVNDDNSLIKEINTENYKSLKERGAIADGMLPKLETAFQALSHDVKAVRIVQAEEVANPLAGTFIQK